MLNSDPRTTLPQVAQLQAAPHWRAIDFISDLHLQPTEPQTVQAWRDYLARSTADAVFLLGDLFEFMIEHGQAVSAFGRAPLNIDCLVGGIA